MKSTFSRGLHRALRRSVLSNRTVGLQFARGSLLAKREYYSLPIIITATGLVGMWTSYMGLRERFNPVKPVSLDSLMQSGSMIGVLDHNQLEALRSALLPAIDAEMVRAVRDKRTENIMKLKRRFAFPFVSASLHLRPVVLPQQIKDTIGMDERTLMHDFGVCHVFWLVNAGPVDYLLDFIREGVRFEMVENPMETMEKSPDDYVHMSKLALGLQSHALCDWVADHSKDPYDVHSNHCLTFAHAFGRNHMASYFPMEDANNAKLLKWTKKVIAENKNK